MCVGAQPFKTLSAETRVCVCAWTSLQHNGGVITGAHCCMGFNEYLCFVHRRQTMSQQWPSWWWQWWDSNMQYTCTALSRQTSRLRGGFRLQMLCIKAAHAFNTHSFSSTPMRLIHTHSLRACANWRHASMFSHLGAVWTLLWPFQKKKKKSWYVNQRTWSITWQEQIQQQHWSRVGLSTTDISGTWGGGGEDFMTPLVDVVTFGIHIRAAHAPRRSEKH